MLVRKQVRTVEILPLTQPQRDAMPQRQAFPSLSPVGRLIVGFVDDGWALPIRAAPRLRQWARWFWWMAPIVMTGAVTLLALICLVCGL